MAVIAGIRFEPRRRAGTGGALAATLATIGASMTVAVSLAARNGAGPLAGATWREPIWLTLAEVTTAGAMVTGTWAALVRYPAAAKGMGVAAAGVLLPLWAGWWWLPPEVRAGVFAAAPLAVVGVAQVAGLGDHDATALAERDGGRLHPGVAGDLGSPGGL